MYRCLSANGNAWHWFYTLYFWAWRGVWYGAPCFCAVSRTVRAAFHLDGSLTGCVQWSPRQAQRGLLWCELYSMMFEMERRSVYHALVDGGCMYRVVRLACLCCRSD